MQNMEKQLNKPITKVSGIIVGRNTLPLVNEGDALFHIARLHGTEEISNQISDMQHYFQDTPIEFF